MASVNPRIQKLIDDLYSVTPEIEAERALLITQSFKETEAMPMIIRRAKALEKILNLNFPSSKNQLRLYNNTRCSF